MPTIFTHRDGDLDAFCSVWAAKTFVPGMDAAAVVFVPANWDGLTMRHGDMAVDIDAGGQGLKGHRDDDGTVHSCFAEIVRRHANPLQQSILKPFTDYVDADDSTGLPLSGIIVNITPIANESPHDAGKRLIDAKKRVSETGLKAIVRSLKVTHASLTDASDYAVLTCVSEILFGTLIHGLKLEKARQQAQSCERLGARGEVALSLDGSPDITSRLCSSGASVVVSVQGNDMSAFRSNKCNRIRLDDARVLQLLKDAGEQNEWFVHSAGFLLVRGSEKAGHAKTPSRVDPRALAEVIASLF